VGADVYGYDANGNMISRTGKAITWHADNTVASVMGPDNVPEGYTYDAGGGRATRSRNLGQPGGWSASAPSRAAGARGGGAARPSGRCAQ
jgi:hypothetical protein